MVTFLDEQQVQCLNMLNIKNIFPLNVFIVNVEMFIFLLESIILIWKVCIYYFLLKKKVYIDNKHLQTHKKLYITQWKSVCTKERKGLVCHW